MNDILENIRNIRNDKGYSQDWVGKKLGLTQNGYSSIESGKNRLTFKILNQIAIIFNMNVIDVITYPEKWGPLEPVKAEEDITKVVIGIELKQEKRDAVLKLLFGENNIEILNK